MCDIKVSVIIPIYNAKRHLEECLDSCLKQTLRQIEIICINDGSTDNSGEILERYAREHSNIVILNQKNQGPGTARNLGIENAHGEFIAFMDSDDFYPDQNVLEKLYLVAVEKEIFICGGSAFYFTEGKVNEYNTSQCFEKTMLMHYRDFQRSVVFAKFIYNTKFLRENEVVFPIWRWYEDPPFFVTAMTKADRFCVISDVVYMIRNTDKVVQFHNDDIVIGILNGIGTLLKISRENRFASLHGDMVADLANNAVYIYERLYCGKAEVRQCYENVLAEIDEALLEKDDRKLRKPKTISEEEIVQMFEHSQKREKKLLDKVCSYKLVLIYGAGKAGRLFYQYLRQRGCKADIKFMVSAENPCFTAGGKKVYSIRECVNAKDDALVVIANKYHARQMEEMARQYEFKHIEVVTYDELLLFGSDMKDVNYYTVF